MKCAFLILLQCICITFRPVEMASYSVSSSSELSDKLKTVEPGDVITLNPNNYEGFTVSVDSVTVIGESKENKDTKVSGTITVTGNKVTIQALILKGTVKANGEEITLKSLSVNGNIEFNSLRGQLLSNSVFGSLTIDSNDGTMRSNSIQKELKINGCGNTFKANTYGSLSMKDKECNTFDVSNAQRSNQSYKFTGSPFWMTGLFLLCLAASQRFI